MVSLDHIDSCDKVFIATRQNSSVTKSIRMAFYGPVMCSVGFCRCGWVNLLSVINSSKHCHTILPKSWSAAPSLGSCISVCTRLFFRWIPCAFKMLRTKSGVLHQQVAPVWEFGSVWRYWPRVMCYSVILMQHIFFSFYSEGVIAFVRNKHVNDSTIKTVVGSVSYHAESANSRNSLYIAENRSIRLTFWF